MEEFCDLFGHRRDAWRCLRSSHGGWPALPGPPTSLDSLLFGRAHGPVSSVLDFEMNVASPLVDLKRRKVFRIIGKACSPPTTPLKTALMSFLQDFVR